MQMLNLPSDPREALVYLNSLIVELKEVLDEYKASFFKISHAAPDKPREGMIRFADGTDWDPGEGKGLYQYQDGDWNGVKGAVGPQGPQGEQGDPGDPATQTPWAQDIDADGFDLSNVGALGIGLTPTAILTVKAEANDGIRLDNATVIGAFYNTSGNSIGIGSLSNHPVLFFANNQAWARLEGDGKFSLLALPTSSAGLSSGMLWRDAGAGNVIKMVP